MIKVIRNPGKEWMKHTELNGQKYILISDDFPGKHAYAKIGLKSLIGYIALRIEYRKR
jgi:hypothetical protein